MSLDAVMTILGKYDEGPLPAALAVVGGVVVLKFGLGFLCVLYRYLLRPSLKLTKFGKYAVVTGATDGIGKAYANALSKRGMSLILISRTESKLKAVADEIDSANAKRNGGKGGGAVDKTRYIVCDYSNFDDAARKRVCDGLDGLDIGVLINNVGVSYRYPMYYHELSETEIGDIVEMNVNSTVHMTRMIIGGMVERRRGAIVNVSSGSAGFTMPLLAEYGAAKMFVERFSRSLDAEYRGRGIRVQCQVPFYVATKLAKLRKSLTVPTADEYAKMGVNWLGYGGVVQPYWLHGFQGWVMSCLPSFVLDRGVMSMHDGIRRRGIKKDAKIAAGGGKKSE